VNHILALENNISGHTTSTGDRDFGVNENFC